MVKTSASRAEGPGFESRLRRDYSGSNHSSDLKIGTPVLPCQAPGVLWSVLGLVGPVSVYCDFVRWKVVSAASIWVWQHVKLSEQIRPWDTLACCWDVKQPTNYNLSPPPPPPLPPARRVYPTYKPKGTHTILNARAASLNASRWLFFSLLISCAWITEPLLQRKTVQFCWKYIAVAHPDTGRPTPTLACASLHE